MNETYTNVWEALEDDEGVRKVMEVKTALMTSIRNKLEKTTGLPSDFDEFNVRIADAVRNGHISKVTIDELFVYATRLNLDAFKIVSDQYSRPLRVIDSQMFQYSMGLKTLVLFSQSQHDQNLCEDLNTENNSNYLFVNVLEESPEINVLGRAFRSAYVTQDAINAMKAEKWERFSMMIIRSLVSTGGQLIIVRG